MKLVDTQTYYRPTQIIRADRWALVTLTVVDGSLPVRYLPLGNSGLKPVEVLRPTTQETTLGHIQPGTTKNATMGGGWTLAGVPWETAPVVQPGQTVTLTDSVYVQPTGESWYRSVTPVKGDTLVYRVDYWQ